MYKFKKIVAALSVVTVLSTGAYVANEEYSTVALAIHLDDEVISVKVKKGTVREILDKQGIVLSKDDRVEPSLDSKIEKGETIKIFKARDITIKDGKNTFTKKTTYRKVGDILNELNIKLGEYDKVSPEVSSKVEFVDTISITRIEKNIETKKEEIDFETVEEANSDLYVGEVSVKTEGKKGEKEIKKQTVKENGEVVSEEVISEEVIVQPEKKVVYVGTKQRPVATYNSQYYTPTYNNNYTTGVVLSNGNSAGEIGSQAAKEMEARTGVSAATWEHIIARESNGQPSARNASGASGLFQTMPGWGSTATVEDQINAAVKAYNSQGLRAWGMR